MLTTHLLFTIWLPTHICIQEGRGLPIHLINVSANHHASHLVERYDEKTNSKDIFSSPSGRVKHYLRLNERNSASLYIHSGQMRLHLRNQSAQHPMETPFHSNTPISSQSAAGLSVRGVVRKAIWFYFDII